ncbi:MAG: phosphatase PAP2 family protein [Hydrogenophaga sp.]|jgi:undecaprenyl-diphosphatase|nr:phosphatase PAP2 family protein [Hydrogenophaga sp.]
MNAVNIQLFEILNLSANASPWLVKLAILTSTVLPGFLLSSVISAIAIGRPRWRSTAIQATFAMALSFPIARLLASLIDASRPFVLGLGHQWMAHASTPGFPSTHATVAAAFAAAVWWSNPKSSMRWLAPFAALAIGWSRVATGVHFPVDVLAGFVLGGTVGWGIVQGCSYMVRRVDNRRSAVFRQSTLSPTSKL